MSSAQLTRLTAQINALRNRLSNIRGDRGLWHNVSEEDLARNKKFLAGAEQQLNQLEERKREVERKMKYPLKLTMPENAA